MAAALLGLGGSSAALAETTFVDGTYYNPLDCEDDVLSADLLVAECAIWQADPAHLTPTELRVVALVAEGLRNAEIAGRLFISKKHVADERRSHLHQTRDGLPGGTRHDGGESDFLTRLIVSPMLHAIFAGSTGLEQSQR